ncbi:MAG: DUF1800 domain-containing protein [Acidobacteriota bacterium]
MRILVSRSILVLAAAGAVALICTTAARTDALTPGEQALHVLNRLGFGPRPGEVDRVMQIGVPAYVREQLYPERIPDGRLDTKLSGYSILSLSNAEMIARFETPLREAKRKIKAARAAANDEDGEAAQADLKKIRGLIPPESRPGRILEELTAARILRAAESESQLNEVMVDFWMNHFNVYAKKGEDRFAIVSFERDTIRPHIWGKFEDLLQATAKSPAMLFYLDNARSVADKEHRSASLAGRDGFGGGQSRRRMNADPEMAARIAQNAPRGLNENYARELMELHTLGVDGGYTQKDVTELARVLTGWSINRPRLRQQDAEGMTHAARRMGAGGMDGQGEPGAFVFRAAAHDNGTKTVLGRTFTASGMDEGERAIAMLAREPATARHIAFQLCQRLVADDPPKGLVERVAKRFLSTGGDLRDTVRVIVESPEFFDPQYYRAKIKSPFEYVVSAIRAVGGATDGRAVSKQIAEMGEPLYLCQPPTGYSDTSEAWVSSGALLARLNFALSLAQGRLPGTTADTNRLRAQSSGGAPGRSVDAAAHSLIGTDVSAETLQTITKQMADGSNGAEPSALVAGLILGSPEFQRQ